MGKDTCVYLVLKPKLRGFAVLAAIVILLAALFNYFFVLPVQTEGTFNPLFVINALFLVILGWIILRVFILAFYTYTITDSYIEKKWEFFFIKDIHKMPLDRIQSYEIHEGPLDFILRTATVVMKHAAHDRPTLTLSEIGIEFVDTIENVIELITKRDIVRE